jgi:hypothetical protein
MIAVRRFKSFLVRHRAFASLIVALLPLILTACTNDGSSGPGYWLRVARGATAITGRVLDSEYGDHDPGTRNSSTTGTATSGRCTGSLTVNVPSGCPPGWIVPAFAPGGKEINPASDASLSSWA